LNPTGWIMFSLTTHKAAPTERARSGGVLLVLLLCLFSALMGFIGGFYFKQWKASGKVAIRAECLRVLDPDTIEVAWKGGKEKVRVAGIDAPEKKQGKKLNDQSKILNIKTDSLLQISQLVIRQMDTTLTGRPVSLVFPRGRVEYDSFGRLLAYVEVSGKDMGEMLLRNGLVYPRPEPHPRLERYYEVNQVAQLERKGLYAFVPR